MAMRIMVTTPDGVEVDVSASGKYSPDVMHDLKNRVAEVLEHATGVYYSTSPNLEQVEEPA